MPRHAPHGGAKPKPREHERVQGPALAEYARASRTPLHILAFLLPLIVIYEVGLALHHDELAASGGVRAWAMIAGAMQTLGVAPSTVVGYSLPAAVIVVMLLLWHVFEKRRWWLKPLVVPLMFAEAVAWMVPLLLFAGVLTQLSEAPAAAPPHPHPAGLVPASVGALSHLSWQSRLVIAIGAGLYEELLFRMALLALLHGVLADLCRLKPGPTVAIALPISAVAFMLYHGVWTGAGWSGLDLWPALLYLVGGLYLGSIYLLRGFGLAVGAHACYNTTVLVLLGPG